MAQTHPIYSADTSWRPRLLARAGLAAMLLTLQAGLLVFLYSFDLGGLLQRRPPDGICVAMSGNLAVCTLASGVSTRLLLALAGLAIISQLSFGAAAFARLRQASAYRR